MVSWKQRKKGCSGGWGRHDPECQTQHRNAVTYTLSCPWLLGIRRSLMILGIAVSLRVNTEHILVGEKIKEGRKGVSQRAW